jgi:pyruvate,water dikinase
MSAFTQFFDSGELNNELLGGKALNLCRLAQARFRVPSGFVLTTHAYRVFVEANHLQPRLSELCREAPGKDRAQFADVSSSILGFFLTAPCPEDITDEVCVAYRRLCKSAGATISVAVRSSATNEDASSSSLAGQHDTFLNVDAGGLLNAIRACWASLWNARSLHHYARQAPSGAPLMAVIVQEMVLADASGVIFSANPLTGARNEAMVNATWGLGEALVSGRVAGDNYVVAKHSGKVKQLEIGTKLIATVPTSTGVADGPVHARKTRKRVLGARQLARLVAECRKIEAYYGAPQDIEWCVKRGRLYILQSRPITTLPETPDPWPVPGPGRWIHGGGAIELLTEPVSPLLETLFVPLYGQALFDWMNRLGLADALNWPIVRGVNGFMFVCLDVRLRPRHLGPIVRNIREHLRSMEEWPRELCIYREQVHRLTTAHNGSGESAGGIYARVVALCRSALRYWLHVSKIVQPITRAEHRFLRFYKAVRGAGDPAPEVFLRGQAMRAIEADRSMYALAQLARRSPGVEDILLGASLASAHRSLCAEPFWHGVREHLQHFGHQIYSFDPLVPTLSESPLPVLAAIRSYLSGHREAPDERLTRFAAERSAALQRLESRLSQRRQRRLNRLLNGAQGGARLREDALFELGLAWGPLRADLLELGGRLHARHSIESAEDIFWLTHEELCALTQALDSAGAPNGAHRQVAERRARWQQRQGIRPPYILPLGSKPSFWWKYVYPAPADRQPPDETQVIRGVGVSPGVITAVARVITAAEQIERLRDGEILVAHATTPAWTPLFARAAGLVTDLGGPLTHGSIVAREYGIPAVMGTGCATQLISDGQEITVDGTGGSVLRSAHSQTRRSAALLSSGP